MTDEQFLQALYAGLLGREPDPAGLQHHLQALQQQQADPSRYGRLAEAFTRGTEFQLRSELRSSPAGSNAFLPDFSGETFGHVVPVGSFCHAAMALKRVGLRQWAGPFDWIFSGVGMAAHCLQDDFATFLDPRQWRSVPQAERHTPEANLCDHRYYREHLGVPFVFNHHDPAAEPAHAAYFQRAVARLRQVLLSPAWKLFVLVSPVPVSLEGLQPLLSALQGRTSNFVLLALQFNTGAPHGQPPALAQALRARRLRHDLLAVELNVGQPSNGVVFPQARDNQMLDRFLRTFRMQPAPLQPL